MKKLKLLLEAIVVLGIILAFVMPGAAMTDKLDLIAHEKPEGLPLLKMYAENIYQYGWEEQASGFWEESRGIRYMCAVDENIVWAQGYDGSGANEPIQEFTRTLNGGELWEADAIFGAPNEAELAMIFALDENKAWAPLHSGDPQGIWHTDDGGESWVRQESADFNEGGAFPNIVHFWDENNGWCQGDPVDGYFEMYTTTDGGNNWVRVPKENIPDPLPGEFGIIGYYDVVGDSVWWGCANAYPMRVFRSRDRGYTWEAFEVPFDAGAYTDLRFKDENNGLAMDRTYEFAFLAETSDGGETWEVIDYAGTCFAANFDYVPGTANMYVSTGVNALDPAARGASYSLDGGHSWSIWIDVEEVQLFGTSWVEGIIGWAGNFNIDQFTGGVYKYTSPPNNPPTAPIIIGEINGNPGVEYEYSFTSTDLDEDDIQEYIVDWGDGSAEEKITGPFKSGETVFAKHTFVKGDFTISASAKDVFGAEGSKGTLEVSIPRVRAKFLEFFDLFPNIYRIFQLLFG